MKELLRYRYVREMSKGSLILIATGYTLFVLAVIFSELPYYKEIYNLNIWFREIVCIFGGTAVFLWIVMIGLMLFCNQGNRYRKMMMKEGECHQGEIIAYTVKRNLYPQHRHRNYGEVSVVQPKTYVLTVRFGSTKIKTAELQKNPERILKSTKCNVYVLGDKFYVTDFDERSFFRIGKRIHLPHDTVYRSYNFYYDFHIL